LPSDLVVTRLMASGSSAGYFQTLKGVVESDGILALWDGLAPGLSLTLNPGITTLIRNVLGGASTSAARNFYVGLASKATASTLTYPWTICKVQMQIEGLRRQNSRGKDGGSGVDDSDVALKSSMQQVLARIVRENGFTGLYVGLLPQLSNAMLKEALLNMVRLEILKVVVYLSKYLWSSRKNGRRT
jgi:adenine nucleotide transporter 17